MYYFCVINIFFYCSITKTVFKGLMRLQKIHSYCMFCGSLLMSYFCVITIYLYCFITKTFFYGCDADSKDTFILQFLSKYYLYDRLFFVSVG